MILTLGLTIVIEGVVVTAYALWRKKPLIHLLLSSLLANLVTQSALWLILTRFPDHYLTVLLISEFCICGTEGLILYFYRYNRLRISEALILSLGMNLASFVIGWFLPI